MRKPRNLSDDEIGIVKAMLRKGWRNDVIHFYFNKAALKAKLLKGEITAPTTIEQDVVFAGAVQALPTTVKAKDLEHIRTILLECLDRAQGGRLPKQQSTRHDL
ncbi:MAG: hypothetical protein ACXWC5_30130 [Burkholderiales bacterium]